MNADISWKVAGCGYVRGLIVYIHNQTVYWSNDSIWVTGWPNIGPLYTTQIFFMIRYIIYIDTELLKMQDTISLGFKCSCIIWNICILVPYQGLSPIHYESDLCLFFQGLRENFGKDCLGLQFCITSNTAYYRFDLHNVPNFTQFTLSTFWNTTLYKENEFHLAFKCDSMPKVHFFVL